jgi:NAD(P)-dependent dehydrogenase (short-subunit alcohol dehydrogenase family)
MHTHGLRALDASPAFGDLQGCALMLTEPAPVSARYFRSHRGQGKVSSVTVVVLTGATRGIGRAAAIELVRRGAEVALVGRDPERVSLVAEEAAAAGGGGRVHGHVADLALMSNVRVLADEIRGRYQHVDVLANNAGALFASRKETPEGFEQTFALNHLAPFLLTNLLRDRLAGGRVVTTASNAHKSARLDLEDLQSERSYSPRVYGISKLCNILFTRELARRAPELRANCFHPGVVRTGFAKNENGIWKALATLGAPFFRSPERGARSLVWLALSDDAAALTGKYIEDEKVVAPSAQAQDNKHAQNLWERSAQLVSLPTDARG